LPQNTVIAVAGNFEEDRIIDVIKENSADGMPAEKTVKLLKMQSLR